MGSGGRGGGGGELYILTITKLKWDVSGSIEQFLYQLFFFLLFLFTLPLGTATVE